MKNDALIIEPGTGWHGDNYRVINLDTDELLGLFATHAEARAYIEPRAHGGGPMSGWSVTSEAYAWTVWGRHAVRGHIMIGDVSMGFEGGQPVYTARTLDNVVLGRSYKTKSGAVAALRRHLERSRSTTE